MKKNYSSPQTSLSVHDFERGFLLYSTGQGSASGSPMTPDDETFDGWDD